MGHHVGPQELGCSGHKGKTNVRGWSLVFVFLQEKFEHNIGLVVVSEIFCLQLADSLLSETASRFEVDLSDIERDICH